MTHAPASERSEATIHLLNWKQIDAATGLPRCSGCGLPIIAEEWAVGSCKGRAAAPRQKPEARGE